MKTILIVDDDTQLRGMFAAVLARNGYRVIQATSGATGLALAHQHLPDLILTDIHMPGGDGSALLRDIRQDPELRSKQVVMMTGRPDLISPRKGMEAGADDFLLKPVSMSALLSCVEARFSRASISWRVEDQQLAQLRTWVPPQLPHEFFTPLAGIIGLMEVLRNDFSSLSLPEVTEIHNDVYLSALRLHRTLRNYLLILELQTASAPTTPPLLPPRKLSESIDGGVAEALRQYDRNADVKIVVDPGCPLPVKPDDLSRMVAELVDNALKFSRQGTPVKIELSSDKRLIVTDQGRGMTPEEIGRIGAFQQFDRKKNEQQGLGLGLILVQKLVASIPAKFQIKSEPGTGTEVQIDFTDEGI